MSELTQHQKDVMKMDDENRRLTHKLREVRSIMRENNIGHLYPGTSQEHEVEVQQAVHNADNYFALQRSNWHNLAESEGWKKVVHNLHGWLRENAPEIILEMPGGIFNPNIAMEFDVKSFLKDKKAEAIEDKAVKIKEMLSNE